jgi:hypothetical protein
LTCRGETEFAAPLPPHQGRACPEEHPRDQRYGLERRSAARDRDPHQLDRLKEDAALNRTIMALDKRLTPQQRTHTGMLAKELGILSMANAGAALARLGALSMAEAEAVHALGAETFAEEFRKSGNPLFALAAIGRWPRRTPLPDDLHRYLSEACREIAALGFEVAVGRMRSAAAPKEALRALALAGRRGRGSNAFADFREHMKAWKATEEYRRAGGVKATDAVADMAKKRGRSASQVRRQIQRGTEIAELPRRRPDVRTSRKKSPI